MLWFVVLVDGNQSSRVCKSSRFDISLEGGTWNFRVQQPPTWHQHEVFVPSLYHYTTCTSTDIVSFPPTNVSLSSVSFFVFTADSTNPSCTRNEACELCTRRRLKTPPLDAHMYQTGSLSADMIDTSLCSQLLPRWQQYLHTLIRTT